MKFDRSNKVNSFQLQPSVVSEWESNPEIHELFFRRFTGDNLR